MALYDAKLTANYCGFTDPSGTPITVCPAGTINPLTGTAVTGPEAPSGTRLPVTPRFKGNLIARYTFDVGEKEAFSRSRPCMSANAVRICACCRMA